MWTNIKYVVKDPRGSQVLKVQRLEHGVVCEYTNKEDIEKVVQEECKSRFTLAHSAPIMKHLLAGKLRYLEDKEIAKAIVDGTYDIPPELDEATKYILREIGDMGREIRKGEGHEINFTTVKERLLPCLPYNMAITKQQQRMNWCPESTLNNSQS